MDEKEKDEIKDIVNIAVKEFMGNLYGGIGKAVVNKIIWAVLGALIYFAFGHYK